MQLLELVLAQLLANILTLVLLAVVAFNVLLFRGYLWTILWAVVIAQALQSAKQRTMECLAALSREEDAAEKSMLTVLWEDLRSGFAKRHETTSLYVIILEFVLDNGISLFAVVGALSLLSHFVPLWFIILCGVVLLAPLIGLLYLLDRSIFCYRRLVSDETLASMFVIGVFFSSVSFIILFLGTESILEGITVWGAASTWVQSMLDNEQNKAEWARQISRANKFAHETFDSVGESYGGTVWWPLVNETLTHYLEHGTLAVDPKGAAGELFPGVSLLAGILAAPATDTDGAGGSGGGSGSGSGSGGLIGIGGGGGGMSVDGVMGGLRGGLQGLNMSMDRAYEIMAYAGMGGKVVAGLSLEGVQLISTIVAFVFGLGLKVVFFFTALFYFTSCGDLLERAVMDLLPVPRTQKAGAVRRLRSGIEGVFFLPCRIACFHGIVTLCLFSLLDVEFPYFATFLTVLLSVIPLVPAYYVAMPWMAARLFTADWPTGVLLFGVHYFTLYWIDNFLCGRGVSNANPYLTGLSIFLGFAVFGTQGVVLGPLIICLGTLIYSSLGYLESSSLAGSGGDDDEAPAGGAGDRAGNSNSGGGDDGSCSSGESRTAPATPTRPRRRLASPSGYHLAEQRGGILRRRQTPGSSHRRGLSLGASPEPSGRRSASSAAQWSKVRPRHRGRGSASSGSPAPSPTGDGPSFEDVALGSTRPLSGVGSVAPVTPGTAVAAAATAARTTTSTAMPPAEVAGALAVLAGMKTAAADATADSAAGTGKRQPHLARRARSPPASPEVAAPVQRMSSVPPPSAVQASIATTAPSRTAAASAEEEPALQRRRSFQQEGRGRQRPSTHVHASSSPPSLTETLLQRVGNALWNDGRGRTAPAAGGGAASAAGGGGDGDGNGSGGGGGGAVSGSGGRHRRTGGTSGPSTVRVRLFLKQPLPTLANSDETAAAAGGASPAGATALAAAAAPAGTAASAALGWRVDVPREMRFEQFLDEVAALMRIERVDGILSRDGLRVERVAFFDEGESLFVAPGKTAEGGGDRAVATASSGHNGMKTSQSFFV